MARVMLAIEARDAKSSDELSEAVRVIDSTYDLLAVSSIFEQSAGQGDAERIHKLRYVNSKALSVCLSMETEKPSKQLVGEFSKIQESLNSSLTHSSIHLYLLFYEEEVSMLPSLYLPHPSLVKRKDWMLAAAELWPQFEHPVLEESLDYLCRKRKIQSADHFFAQGKILLALNLKDK